MILVGKSEQMTARIYGSLLACCLAMTSVHAAPVCEGRSASAQAQSQAKQLVEKIPEVQKMDGAYSEAGKKQMLFRGKCYSSVSVFFDHSANFEIWNVFWVNSVTKTILVEDLVLPESASAQYIDLSKWQANGHPMFGHLDD